MTEVGVAQGVAEGAQRRSDGRGAGRSAVTLAAVAAVVLLPLLTSCSGGDDDPAAGSTVAAGRSAARTPAGAGTAGGAASMASGTAARNGVGRRPSIRETADEGIRPATGTPARGKTLDRGDRREAGFVLPSGNIACLFTRGGSSGSGSVRCELERFSYAPPRKPAGCTYDWGQAVTLTSGVPRFECVSDSVRGSGDPVTLPYGSGMRFGSLECTSSEAGVRCADSRSGGGFELNRMAYRFFGR